MFAEKSEPGSTATASPTPRPAAHNPNQILQSIQEKKRIIRDLIEGHLSLFEAVARFQHIHRNSIAKLEHSLGVPSGPTDPESMCRAVIGWAHLQLSDRPEQAEAISDRLESELQQYLERHGRVSLPPGV